MAAPIVAYTWPCGCQGSGYPVAFRSRVRRSLSPDGSPEGPRPEAQGAGVCLPLSGRVGQVAALQQAVAEQDRSEGIAVCSMPPCHPVLSPGPGTSGNRSPLESAAQRRRTPCGGAFCPLQSKRRPMEPEVGKGFRRPLPDPRTTVEAASDSCRLSPHRWPRTLPRSFARPLEQSSILM